MTERPRTMRDAVIEQIIAAMEQDRGIFFLSADLGAPSLDKLRARFPERFINVGIAEQNLINVATGLALEGYTVFAFAISAFLSMRCFEQIRINLAILSQLRKINVNLLGIGAGLSYDLAGPSHHCLEDVGTLRTLPNLTLLSPSDPALAAALIPYVLGRPEPKYLRLDSKPLIDLGPAPGASGLERGFRELCRGGRICLVATGFMTQKALSLKNALLARGIEIGVVDLFRLNGFGIEALRETLRGYSDLITLEEGFLGCGGLEQIVSDFLRDTGGATLARAFGISREYRFEVGDREHLHFLAGCGEPAILDFIEALARQQAK